MRSKQGEEMRYLKNFLMLSLVLTTGSTLGLGQDAGCPRQAVKVPQDLAKQLLHRAFRTMGTEADEKERIIQAAENSKGGISRLFCAEAVDLNRDGKPDLLIHQADVDVAYCGAHNCPVWVYRRTDGGLKLLLDATAGYFADRITALKSSTNGYRDIRTQYHQSAVDREITTYKFDGKGYRARVCMTATYDKDERGRERVKYTRYRCS